MRGERQGSWPSTRNSVALRAKTDASFRSTSKFINVEFKVSPRAITDPRKGSVVKALGNPLKFHLIRLLATGYRATHGTGTPRSTTGPLLGSSSTAWFTPAGVRTSIALGSCPSGTLHTPAVAPAGQRPKV